ncbi:MAG TPA: septum site-determining protein MinC [Clostridia bacterium]|jgi:septum site-determining protein MinC|nr:septum site-determining protein MinC [Clostridia bacterium]
MRNDGVTIKGTKEGLLIILDGELDFPVILRKLEEKITRVENFFAGAQAILDLSGRLVQPEQLEQLEHLISSQHGIEIIRIINQGCLDEKGEREAMEGAIVEDGLRNGNGNRNRRVTLNENEEQLSTLIIKRTLRSGQRVNYDGNVVILGDVNPGAEVIASGDIVVMGAFRGVAHAGAKGNEKAIITAFSLQPTQLRIANIITRPPDEENSEPNQPEVAKIKDGMVIIESSLNFSN